VSSALKRCPRCERELPPEEFARDASKASGHKSLCKACDREKARRYYAANRERKLAQMAERYAARREELRADPAALAAYGRAQREGRRRRRALQQERHAAEAERAA
jgi:hypothetical protein